MINKHMTAKEVEQEIRRLRSSPFVELARQEENIRYRRQQILHDLQVMEKKGRELAGSGITLEMLNDDFE